MWFFVSFGDLYTDIMYSQWQSRLFQKQTISNELLPNLLNLERLPPPPVGLWLLKNTLTGLFIAPFGIGSPIFNP